MPVFPEATASPSPNPLPSQETGRAAAAGAAAATLFSFTDSPKAKASSGPARGGSVSENERAACASDLAAGEDEEVGGEGKRRLQERCGDGEGARHSSESGTRGEWSGRRTPQPAKRSCCFRFHFVRKKFEKTRQFYWLSSPAYKSFPADDNSTICTHASRGSEKVRANKREKDAKKGKERAKKRRIKKRKKKLSLTVIK